MMKRRDFLHRAGMTIGAASAVLTAPRNAAAHDEVATPKPMRPDDWKSIREQFPLASDRIHLATFFLVSHPRCVSEAIERYRRALDNDPIGYIHDHRAAAEARVGAAAAAYMGGRPEQIAMTDSTTMGLGLLYGGLHLEPGQEIVSTTHDHYSTEVSLQERAKRTGAKVIQIPLYEDPAKASVDEILSRVRKAITDRTRVLAVTWVHSSTGVKLPIGAMAGVIREINAKRSTDDRVLFCVDGVHGFGIENATMEALGCDFFIAGTHKWIFGPRGTGLIWARPEAWKSARVLIPSFGMNYDAWLGEVAAEDVPIGDLMSPGGFHSFEHRWAVDEAFGFHQKIGKARVQERIHSLNTMAKAALAKMPHVNLRTPLSPELSSGIICFDVASMRPMAVVERLHRRGIIASVSPYRVSHARIAPSLINNEDEIDKTMKAIHELA